MAAGTVDLHTLAAFYRIPYGTLARWALHERWPIARPRSQRFGTPALYNVQVVAQLAGARLEQRKRDAEAA
jgi:hypothetical protein